jgi:hypothetical protein
MRNKVLAAVTFAILGLLISVQANATMICIAPVFRAEMMLQELVSKYPERARDLANNVLYLREKYCREMWGEPETDEIETINETCTISVGTYRDEKVFFNGRCGD